MTTVRLSSKGQLVLPKPVREELGLVAGDRLDVEVAGRKIILEPSREQSAIEVLYGRYAGVSLLKELEKEHRRELANELEMGA